MIIGTPAAVVDITDEELVSVNVQRLEATGCGTPGCHDCGGDATPAVCYEFEAVTLVGTITDDEGKDRPIINKLTVRMDTDHAAAICASLINAMSVHDPEAWAYALDFNEKYGTTVRDQFRMTRDGTIIPEED
jgi:hypothetical protein